MWEGEAATLWPLLEECDFNFAELALVKAVYETFANHIGDLRQEALLPFGQRGPAEVPIMAQIAEGGRDQFGPILKNDGEPLVLQPGVVLGSFKPSMAAEVAYAVFSGMFSHR